MSFSKKRSWDNRDDVKKLRLQTSGGRTWTKRLQWLVDGDQNKIKFEIIAPPAAEVYHEVLASKKDGEIIWQRFKDGQSIADTCSILTNPVPASLQSRKMSEQEGE